MARRKRHAAGRRLATVDHPAPPSEQDGGASGLFPRPWILAGATALWIARPMFPSEGAASRGDGLPAVMLWLLLALLWLLGVVRKQEFRFRFGWVEGALGLLVAWHSLAAIWAASHRSPRPAINMLWEWAGLAVSFWLTRQVLVGRRETRAMAAVMVGLAVGLAGYGLYQYFFEMPATRITYQADPERCLADADLWCPPGSPERMLFEKRLASVEPMATFALTNSLAGFLAPWLVVLAGILTIGSPSRRKALSVWGPTGCALVIATCLLLTKSRSGYLATVIGLIGVGALWRQKTVRLPRKAIGATVIAVAILMAAVVASGGLDREVLSEAGKSLLYRGQYWQATVAIITEHPWLGCGPGNFQDAYKLYKLPEASEEIADPHNFLLEIWSTAGTPAAVAFLAVIAAFFGGLVRRAQPEKQAEEDHPWFVYGGAVLGFLVALPVGLLSPAPPTLAVVAWALPAAAITAALLLVWVQEGELPAAVPATGVVVLLVNLSAAGGIGFSSVCGTLWLLVALALNLGGTNGRALPRVAGAGLLAVGVTLVCACYATAYGPVLRCQGAIWLAQRHPLQAETYLLEAAQADRRSFEPWGQLASLAFSQWEKHPTEEALSRLKRYSEELLQRAPHSAPAWQATGQRYQAVYQRTRDATHLAAAVAAYRRAVELYPTSATHRAELAMALRAAGDEAGYQDQRDIALRLDRANPHADKKLGAELRKSLERNNSRQNGLR